MFLKSVKRAIRVRRRINNYIQALFYFNKNKKKLYLSFFNFFKFKEYESHTQGLFTALFNNREFVVTSPFWFLHSVDEIFVQEVYKFPSLKKDPLILDCGANYGLSVLYFKTLFPESKVIAFEADPKIYSILKKNIAQTDIKSVDLINAAVWKERTNLSFASEGSVGGRIDIDKNLKNDIKIHAIRLKDYLIQPIDFLKIDIEGAEHEVLRDCKDLLINVKNLFIEYHVLRNEEQHLHEILSWVNSAGFNYYIKEAWNNMSYPFMQIYNDHYQMQLNVFCYREKRVSMNEIK